MQFEILQRLLHQIIAHFWSGSVLFFWEPGRSGRSAGKVWILYDSPFSQGRFIPWIDTAIALLIVALVSMQLWLSMAALSIVSGYDGAVVDADATNWRVTSLQWCSQYASNGAQLWAAWHPRVQTRGDRNYSRCSSLCKKNEAFLRRWWQIWVFLVASLQAERFSFFSFLNNPIMVPFKYNQPTKHGIKVDQLVGNVTAPKTRLVKMTHGLWCMRMNLLLQLNKTL